MQHIVTFYEWPDEIWSLWHVQGTFSEALSRVPYDWPPLFSIVAWVWMQIAGPSLEASRVLMIQFALLTLVFMYRAALVFYAQIAPDAKGRRDAAWVALAATASMAYLIFASVEVRAYGVVLMFGSLALWLTLRWLKQPANGWRTVLLALTLALMFYSTFTTVLYIGFLCFVVVVIRPRLIPRLIVVGVLAMIIALPAVIQFMGNATSRLNVMAQPPDPFLQEMFEVFRSFGGTSAYVAIMGVALIIVAICVLRRRLNWRYGLILLAWVSVPAAVYVLKDNREFLNVRYMWWVVIGIVMLIGAATVYFPRIAQWGVILLLLGLTYAPVDWLSFRVGSTEAAPMRMVLSWFAEHIRPGDVIIKDPNCACGVPIAWDYFVPQFFPQGRLPWATEPGNHSRVWYLATTGWKQDEKLKADIMKGRKESIFVGPWNFLLRLYEGPPLWQGVSFGDQIGLNGFEVLDNRETFRENDSIQVKLWWSALKKPSMDYSISLAVLDKDGNLLTQIDGAAQADGTPQQMSAWEPGQYYEDYRTIKLPIGTPSQDYKLVVTVYDWQTGQRLIPAANTTFPLAGANNDYLLLENLSVVSY